MAWVVRVTGYSLLQNPWVVLLLEPLHGLTFGLMWLGGVHYVSHTFPKDLAASAMGSINAAAFGLGPAIGTLLGGICYDALGARQFCRWAALGMGICVVAYYFIDKRLAATEERSRLSSPVTNDTTSASTFPKNDLELGEAPTCGVSLQTSGLICEDPRRLYDHPGCGGLLEDLPPLP
jgi:MFS family permease